MKNNYSIFTELFYELASYSKKIDTASASRKHLIELQKLSQEVKKCYDIGYFDFNKYMLLNRICNELKADMRENIRLKEAIKSIEKKTYKIRIAN